MTGSTFPFMYAVDIASLSARGKQFPRPSFSMTLTRKVLSTCRAVARWSMSVSSHSCDWSWESLPGSPGSVPGSAPAPESCSGSGSGCCSASGGIFSCLLPVTGSRRSSCRIPHIVVQMLPLLVQVCSTILRSVIFPHAVQCHGLLISFSLGSRQPGRSLGLPGRYRWDTARWNNTGIPKLRKVDQN